MCQDNGIVEDASVFRELTVCRYLIKGDCRFLGGAHVKNQSFSNELRQKPITNGLTTNIHAWNQQFHVIGIDYPFPSSLHLLSLAWSRGLPAADSWLWTSKAANVGVAGWRREQWGGIFDYDRDFTLKKPFMWSFFSHLPFFEWAEISHPMPTSFGSRPSPRQNFKYLWILPEMCRGKVFTADHEKVWSI